jgi:hypothetical protein
MKDYTGVPEKKRRAHSSLIYPRNLTIQGVSETGALILTGNRTHQKEQLFSLPFWRKTLRNG